MKKLFISQPMRGKTEEAILEERNKLIAKAIEKYGGEVEILDTYFADYDGNALGYLGRSISMLAKADIGLFAADWKGARGCRVEHLCCEEYGVEIIEA